MTAETGTPKISESRLMLTEEGILTVFFGSSIRKFKTNARGKGIFFWLLHFLLTPFFSPLVSRTDYSGMLPDKVFSKNSKKRASHFLFLNFVVCFFRRLCFSEIFEMSLTISAEPPLYYSLDPRSLLALLFWEKEFLLFGRFARYRSRGAPR